MCASASRGRSRGSNTDAETQDRVIEGLPSLAASDSDGNGAGGPVDVAEVGMEHVRAHQSGRSAEAWDALGPVGAMVGTVVKVDAEDERSVFADLNAFEASDDPDGDDPAMEGLDTNPFAIEVNPKVASGPSTPVATMCSRSTTRAR